VSLITASSLISLSNYYYLSPSWILEAKPVIVLVQIPEEIPEEAMKVQMILEVIPLKIPEETPLEARPEITEPAGATTGGDAVGGTGGRDGSGATTTGTTGNDDDEEDEDAPVPDPIDFAQVRVFKAFLRYIGFTPASVCRFWQGDSLVWTPFKDRRRIKCRGEYVQVH
jgi:hypothetical protein